MLGANGSGKTTLVRGLLGLATVMRGDVELLGRPLRTRRDRAAIGYVPQRHTVGGAIASTVREVVSSGRLPRLGLLGRLGAADRAVVAEAIDAVRLTGFADTNVAELSGGQQRRVLIARALAAEPGVLVMDEPTAGVDQVSQQALADTIRQLATRGVPMIIVTHEVGPLADVLTRAVVVADGRITYDGPPPTRPAARAALGGPPPPARPARRGRQAPVAVDRAPAGRCVMAVLELLQYDFMRRALLAGLLVGLAAPVVGIFLVQRRLALIGDGMGHVALAGVAIGIVTGRAPVWTALVAAVAAAVAIELIRARGRTSGDVALAVMFYGGIAFGVALISRSPEGTPANLNAYLFGAITTTSPRDLVTFAALAAVVLRGDRGARAEAVRGGQRPRVRPGRRACRSSASTWCSRC